jgi:hypothetical protein
VLALSVQNRFDSILIRNVLFLCLHLKRLPAKRWFVGSFQTEMSVKIGGLAEFRRFYIEHPEHHDPTWIVETAARIVNDGAVEPLTGIILPKGWTDDLASLREGLSYNGIISRVRAVMLCLAETLASRPNPRIYAPEGVTDFALRLRGIFPKFIGSEFASNDAQRNDLFPIPHEDLQALSFPCDVFDAVVTNEVLEHVPSIDAALGEIFRVLKPGGWHVGTVPFAADQDEGIVKAMIMEGALVHLTTPEYHGNPISGEGSLVFEIPGWNILDRARAAGFTEAHMRFILSARHACMCGALGGVMVLCLRK